MSPPRHTWPDLALQHWQTVRSDQRALAFRRELGLPVDRPVIMTGHQAHVWHAGILAKYFAADSLARQISAAAAWLVVDQDEQDYTPLRYPAHEEGALRAREWTLGPAPRAGVAACNVPAFDPGPPPNPPGDEPVFRSVRQGLSDIARALAARRSEPNAALQVARAVFDLLTPLLELRPLIAATSLGSVSLGSDFIARLRSEARRAADLYNQAVERFPDSGLTRLRITNDAQQVELPLWRLAPGRPRARVFSTDPADPSAIIAPRALVMTGLVRLYACDLFIHGKGGAVYDPVTEDWLSAWLGVTLAPAAVATADLYLPLAPKRIEEAEVARARWRAHRARHDPALIGDAAAAAEKSAFVRRIAQLRADHADPAPEYLRMHQWLERYRAAAAPALAALDAEARAARDRLASRDVAFDRTWPFALHAPAALTALREACR
ncbi:MAG: hypothetical protein SFZ24_03565 [Planctomycetota bacterium]|nr:hypothetical protein [Planctomycetota bacterium]